MGFLLALLIVIAALTKAWWYFIVYGLFMLLFCKDQLTDQYDKDRQDDHEKRHEPK